MTELQGKSAQNNALFPFYFAFPLDEPIMLSFSGGRSSAFLLFQMLKFFGGQPDNLHILFANTGKEMPETLDFVKDCAINFGCKIVWLEYRFDFDQRKTGFVIVDYEKASRDGEPFSQLIDAKQMLPNVATRFCTEELKIKTMQRYMRSIGHRDYLNVIGLRFDEPGRIAKMRARNEKSRLRHTVAPLNSARVTKFHVGAFWKAMPFDLALENHNGTTPMGNCDCCFMKGKKKLSSIGRDWPSLLGWWIGKERQIMKSMPASGNLENASFIKGMPYERLPSLDISSLFDDEILCIGCTD